MKKLLITLFVVLGTAWWLFGQCSYPQLGIGQGLHAIDSATIQGSEPRCTPCPTAGVVSWELVGDLNWQFTLFSEDSNQVSVQLTKGCDSLLWDTCGVIPPLSMGATWAFTKRFSVYGDCQIHVSGNIGQEVFIDVKGSPSQQEELYTVIGVLDTCGTILSTDAAGNTTEVIYKRMDDGKIYELPLRAGTYVVETFFPAGRKVIQVVE